MSPVGLPPETASPLAGLASVIHDLRNPLATIHGSAEMLARSSLSQPQVHRIARNMYCASVRMRELLQECLDRSTSRERVTDVCDIRELITSAVEKISVSAEFQSVRISQSVPDGLAISLNRYQIQRVLVNLLVNALEAMPYGGTIQITAVSDCRSVLIQVRDTGPGIAPEIRDRLFQPFATAGKANGIGLGLAFSRQTVIDHGGEIWAESTDTGACFVIRLPGTIPPARSASS